MKSEWIIIDDSDKINKFKNKKISSNIPIEHKNIITQSENTSKSFQNKDVQTNILNVEHDINNLYNLIADQQEIINSFQIKIYDLQNKLKMANNNNKNNKYYKKRISSKLISDLFTNINYEINKIIPGRHTEKSLYKCTNKIDNECLLHYKLEDIQKISNLIDNFIKKNNINKLENTYIDKILDFFYYKYNITNVLYIKSLIENTINKNSNNNLIDSQIIIKISQITN